VLLAIETALPGSIGSTCSSSAEHAPGQQDAKLPLAIIYDEIDAHVGGRAAVTMAKLLSDQSRVRRSRDRGRRSERGSQIIAITHSASLAAIADRHIVVERCLNRGSNSVPVRTYVVDGSSRRREIARMASGDLASDEAEKFAEALIRDAMLHREMSSP
jgi:DNA repair protein RecN (Recombination protein N)